MHDVFTAMAELKLLDSEPAGTIGGLGAVYGNTDSHGDMIVHGAFAESLAQHKRNGTMPKMYLNHSAFMPGGSPLTVGVWTDMEETAEGLRVKGQVFATVPHPEIALLCANLRAGQINGLSIAFGVSPGGAVIGRKASEPKRTLNKLDLLAVDIVGHPSNALARIDHVKSSATLADVDAACIALVRAARLHRDAWTSDAAPTAEQRAALLDSIEIAHIALKGEPISPKLGFDPTIREFQSWLHLPLAEGGKFGYSNTKARELADLVYKSAHRDDVSGQAKPLDKETVAALADALGDFSLPAF